MDLRRAHATAAAAAAANASAGAAANGAATAGASGAVAASAAARCSNVCKHVRFCAAPRAESSGSPGGRSRADWKLAALDSALGITTAAAAAAAAAGACAKVHLAL